MTVAGEELQRNDWTTDLRRWCPACFARDPGDDSLPGRSAAGASTAGSGGTRHASSSARSITCGSKAHVRPAEPP